MKYLMITDDDHENAVEVEFEMIDDTPYTRTTWKKGLDEPIVELITTQKADLPGKFIYFLKRSNDMRINPERGPWNAGAAYEQENGDLWIDSGIWINSERTSVIFVYTDGYGKDWLLD